MLGMSLDEFWRTTPVLLNELMQAAADWHNPEEEREVIRVQYADQCGW